MSTALILIVVVALASVALLALAGARRRRLARAGRARSSGRYERLDDYRSYAEAARHDAARVRLNEGR